MTLSSARRGYYKHCNNLCKWLLESSSSVDVRLLGLSCDCKKNVKESDDPREFIRNVIGKVELGLEIRYKTREL